uniref:Fibronectin type-III domain-containing protein n=1 Tax=Ciona savignyi TaxID=51511 RepID=H2YMN0_CIOSA
MDNNHTVEEARYSEATDFLGEVGYPDLVCPALNIENPNVGLPVNMVLVQVNPSETFIIRNEDGSHRTFTGPTEVPMVSPGRNIPTIYAPPGYISHVIDEQGIRRVVVLHDEQAIRPTGHQISQQQYPIPVLPPRNEAYNSTPEGHFMPVPAIDPAEEPGCESVQEWLNKISTPQVKSVSARTALVTWNGPTELHKSFNHDNVVYQLSVEGKKGFWDQVD